MATETSQILINHIRFALRRKEAADELILLLNSIPVTGADTGIIVVAQDGGDFATITEGLAAASSGDVVLVYPGTYAENVTIPSGVRLVGFPAGAAVTISGADTTGVRVTMMDNTTLREVTVVGPSDGANPAIDADAISTVGVLFTVRIIGGSGTSTGPGVSKTGTGTLLMQLVGHNGGVFGGHLLDATAGLVRLVGGGLNGNAGTSDALLSITGTAQLVGQLVTAAAAYVATDGLRVGGTASVQLANMLLNEAGNITNGLHIISDGVTIDMSDSHLHGTTADILVDPALTGTGTVFNFSSGDYKRARRIVPVGWSPDLFLAASTDTDTEEDNPGLKFEGAGEFGSREFPGRLAIGTGAPTVFGMEAYTYDASGTTYTRRTEDARSSDGSAFTWGTDINDALLVGWPSKLSMLQIHATIAAVLGAGSYAVEVVTATGPLVWTELNRMAADKPNGPPSQYGDDILTRAVEENIRIDIDATAWDSWVVSDPPSSGSTLYWVRIRNVAAITTQATIERIRCGKNFASLSSGAAERYGANEARTTFWEGTGEDLSAPSGGANAPGNADITLSANVSYRQARSQYATGQDNRAGTQIPIPRGLDTSRPILLALEWTTDGISTNAVQWDLYVTEVREDDVLNSTTIELPVVTQSIVPPGTALQKRLTLFQLSIPDVKPGDNIAFMLWRRGSVDTNPDDAIAISMAWEGVFWS